MSSLDLIWWSLRPFPFVLTFPGSRSRSPRLRPPVRDLCRARNSPLSLLFSRLSPSSCSSRNAQGTLPWQPKPGPSLPLSAGEKKLGKSSQGVSSCVFPGGSCCCWWPGGDCPHPERNNPQWISRRLKPILFSGVIPASLKPAPAPPRGKGLSSSELHLALDCPSLSLRAFQER